MDWIFSPLKAIRRLSQGGGDEDPPPPPESFPEERNPLKTPSLNQDPVTLKISGSAKLTPAEKKKRRISFRKGFEMEGTSGYDRVILPCEKEGGTSSKKKVSPKKKSKTPPKKKSKTPPKKKAKTPPKKKAKTPPKRKAKTPPKKKTSQLVKVKSEATRSSGRTRTMKKGFYNEKRLRDLAWKGTGTQTDPIYFQH